MKELTKAEEQIMRVLWELGEAYVKDIVERLPRPKPAYNTVSTIIRILERKGFVGHEAFGKTHRYRPLVAKERYTHDYLRNFVRNYFGDSYQDLVHFFARDRNLSVAELEDILKILRDEIRRQKADDHD
ncbi:MAG: BlaI/MecI/CopY family transcriptional regulator [Candidatus Aminicenantes bacterium]|nr:BlaI/MecI/CopY family transcriptional regulator [Candidatus Aminicenantes bacterium]